MRKTTHTYTFFTIILLSIIVFFFVTSPARTGVTCNAICPGWVLTPLVEQQIKARAEKMGVTFDEAKVLLLITCLENYVCIMYVYTVCI